MRLKMITLAALLFSSVFASSIQAADWEKFWSHFHLVKQRNNAWPQPFALQDQQTYHAMFAPMVDKGWQVECTLTDYHFDDRGKLNSIGMTKLASILQAVPESRQQVLITQQLNPKVEDTRLSSVQDQLSAWKSNLNVTSTNLRPAPQTGSFVEATYSAFIKSAPAPSLGSADVGDVGG